MAIPGRRLLETPQRQESARCARTPRGLLGAGGSRSSPAGPHPAVLHISSQIGRAIRAVAWYDGAAPYLLQGSHERGPLQVAVVGRHWKY